MPCIYDHDLDFFLEYLGRGRSTRAVLPDLSYEHLSRSIRSVNTVAEYEEQGCGVKAMMALISLA